MKTVTLVSCLMTAASGFAATQSISLQPIQIGGVTSAQRAASETTLVTAKGSGATKVEALKDAYRDAVEKAVGQFVDAEQMMKNDEIITDQVLTQSNAYIEKYDLLKESEADGLVKVFIKATVRKAELVKKILGVMPGVTVNVGQSLQSLHAQMTSKEARNADAAALVANALKGVNPVAQLMTMSLASTHPQISKAESWGREAKVDADHVRLGYLFKMEVDKDRYFKEFLPKLKQILDQVSLKEPKAIRLNAQKDLEYSTYRYNRKEYLNAGPMFEDRLRTASCTSCADGFMGYFDELKCWTWSQDQQEMRVDSVCTLCTFGAGDDDVLANGMDVVVVTEVNSSGAKAVLYSVDGETAKAINDWQSAYTGLGTRERARKLIYDVVFKDNAGGEVAAFTWDFNDPQNRIGGGYGVCWNAGFMNSAMGPRWRGPLRRLWLVAPYVRSIAERYVEWHAFDFKKDDLAKIASVTIELAE